MINEKEIVFVTTSLYTKWMKYQSDIIRQLFPESKQIIINGDRDWPKSWFYWIDVVKKMKQTYYVHIDEDFFITSKTEFLKCIEKMENENLGLLGPPDGYHQFRQHNPVAFNSFLMFGRIADLKKTDFSRLSFTQNGDQWNNSLNLYFKESYLSDYKYDFVKHFGFQYDNFEPYYVFMWTMKENGVKFGYLFPHYDDKMKTSNPRLAENSEDIGIHMWFTRKWHSDLDVLGLPNNVRYKMLEDLIRKQYHLPEIHQYPTFQKLKNSWQNFLIRMF